MQTAKELFPIEAIEAAAQWWVDSLSRPSFDNGAKDEMSDVASLFAFLNAASSAPSAEQLASFKQSLITLALEYSCFGDRLIIESDYHPEGILAAAAKMAGISGSCFSWKTRVWIYADKVEARAGYGAEPKIIWQAS